MRCTMLRRKERGECGALEVNPSVAAISRPYRANGKEPEQSRLHVKLHVKEVFFVVVASRAANRRDEIK